MIYLYQVRHGENPELRFSLRTLAKNLPPGEVVIAGYTPPWVTNVYSVPMKQQGTKHRNAYDNLRYGLAAIGSGPVVVMNDDFYTLLPTDPVPAISVGSIGEFADAHNPISSYTRRLRITAADLGDDAPCYEAHAPFPADTERLLALIADLAVGEREPEYKHWRTYYGNLYHTPTYAEDQKARDTDWLPPEGTRFASSKDQTWRGAFSLWMRQQYPEPCQYEREA